MDVARGVEVGAVDVGRAVLSSLTLVGDDVSVAMGKLVAVGADGGDSAGGLEQAARTIVNKMTAKTKGLATIYTCSWG